MTVTGDVFHSEAGNECAAGDDFGAGNDGAAGDDFGAGNDGAAGDDFGAGNDGAAGHDTGEERRAHGGAAVPAPRGENYLAETVTEEQPESEQQPVTAFEEFAASWVPPWARSLPGFMIEPAADYTAEELAVGRLAYAEPDELPNPDDFEPGLGDPHLRGALEAILMVVDEPVTVTMLAQVLEEPTGRVASTLFSLAQEYARSGRGFELRSVAGGWRFYTRGEYANFVERFVLDGQQIRLTQAALETLAVVAYKQPVSRSRVAAIRGVNCDGVMKTLVTRGLIEECGTEDNGAHSYRTTRLFLEKIGVNSVADLPSLGPFLPDDVSEIDFAQR